MSCNAAWFFFLHIGAGSSGHHEITLTKEFFKLLREKLEERKEVGYFSLLIINDKEN